MAVLVDNEAGVLARVIGLFSGRGYNIESLTVAEVDAAVNRSRISIVTSGTPQVIAQIKAQLERLIPVHAVADLTVEGPSVEREMALVKVNAIGDKVFVFHLAFICHLFPRTHASLFLATGKLVIERWRTVRPDSPPSRCLTDRN